MIVSVNWLKKYTGIDLPVNELATLVGARLVEIEETLNLGEKYKDAVIVHAVEVAKMEGSDHLNIVKIDDGKAVSGVERDENGLVQVVCGAPNIASGQTVVWLPPAAIVPETFGKAEQFKLDARKLRGVVSNGMIASARELDLSDEHEGILVLDSQIPAGTSFAKYLELDDYLLDIENKSLTHRPDCFGIVGFAREVAGIQGKAFKTPDWLLPNSLNGVSADGKADLQVKIDNPELSSRYLGVVMSGADGSRKSPLQIQSYLSRIGIRPINAVVDVTNYLMVLTGQPLHAFDYDKLVKVAGGKPEIHVRGGRMGEKLELLDGRTIELSESDIVIAAGETAVGLAGAMGGASTAIDNDTKNIIIESATFNLYNLRATQMRHGIFSEAITRFTKGQPAELSAPVLGEAIRLMGEWASAKLVSDIAEDYPVNEPKTTIDFAYDETNAVLGSDYTEQEIIDTLTNVDFEVERSGGRLQVVAPYWRGDIHIVEDIIEEIGRLNGFDNIKPVLPKRDFTAASRGEFEDFRARVRKILVRAGANEVLTYSFVHGKVLERANQSPDNSYRIVNSISPDLQYYRQTLTPSLLELVHPNVKQGFDTFALFEANKTHQKMHGLTDESVPVETDMLGLVVASRATRPDAPYYQAKKIFDYVCWMLGGNVKYEPMGNQDAALFKPYEPRRSAKVVDGATGTTLGVIGEYKKAVAREFKLPDFAAGFEVNLRELYGLTVGRRGSYRPLSRYPGTERDICFKVDDSVAYARIIESVQHVLDGIVLETSVEPVDIYQQNGDTTKNVTIRVKLTSHDHTLKSEEVTQVINSVAKAVISDVKAVVV